MTREELTGYGASGEPGLSDGRKLLPLMILAALMPLGGCVTVKAPEKPIVIELNVNIRQEVIYRLAKDADKTIEQNKDIF